jgi:hypothetical protein
MSSYTTGELLGVQGKLIAGEVLERYALRSILVDKGVSLFNRYVELVV